MSLAVVAGKNVIQNNYEHQIRAVGVSDYTVDVVAQSVYKLLKSYNTPRRTKGCRQSQDYPTMLPQELLAVRIT